MSAVRAASTCLPETRLEAAPVLDALLMGGHAAMVPVRGGSMSPTLRAGDVAVVSPFLGLPRPGQIVMARSAPDRLVVHRLVHVEMRNGRRLYRLRGDAEKGPDAGVLREDLVGRVTEVVRDGVRLPIDDPRFAPPAGLRRLAAARRLRRLARGAGIVVLALLCLFGVVAAEDAPAPAVTQEQTIAPAADYLFGPGDVLSLRIWNGQKIDELKLTVQSDGEAFLPVMGIGALQVAGRTVVELKKDIEKRFQAIYKETHVELLITKYAGHRVSLMGEVKTTARNDSGPGSWALEGPTRLVEFLSAHGGPSQDADVMRIQVIRPGAPRRELNLFRAVFQGNEGDDPWLRHGDLVFVPSLSMGNRKVFVLGEVNQPGVVNILDKMGLVEAISRSGGFNSKGYMKGVVVLKRGEDGKAEMTIANFKEMFKEGDLEADVPLAPGDIVFVPRRAIATLQEVMSIIAPALGIIESIYIIDNFRKD
ncbi:MAG TPA: SLBB domain-containing protein [Candidatus Binatia bacterium]|nr:SLBB domain-containing protein [Candidatus Binatia bacterium]